MAELEQMQGTGSEGRVTKKDILALWQVGEVPWKPRVPPCDVSSSCRRLTIPRTCASNENGDKRRWRTRHRRDGPHAQMITDHMAKRPNKPSRHVICGGGRHQPRALAKCE